MSTTSLKVTNRITELFSKKEKNILNIYFTAGFPMLNDTPKIIELLDQSGADIIEIGIPFSDPLADGPTIQQSNDIALENGMTLKILLSQLKDLRKKTQIPVLLMGYLNPVMQYGIEKFCKDIAAIGIDGVIIPDLPAYEYAENYKGIFEENNLSNIFLITPNTSDERLQYIDKISSGFIYMVSTDSTTGNEKKSLEQQEAYFKRVKNQGLKNPTLIGFNIKDNNSYSYACQYATGAIIGSAFINVIKKSKDLSKDIPAFIKSVKGA